VRCTLLLHDPSYRVSDVLKSSKTLLVVPAAASGIATLRVAITMIGHKIAADNVVTHPVRKCFGACMLSPKVAAILVADLAQSRGNTVALGRLIKVCWGR
jgi:hypothetical protein